MVLGRGFESQLHLKTRWKDWPFDCSKSNEKINTSWFLYKGIFTAEELYLPDKVKMKKYNNGLQENHEGALELYFQVISLKIFA